MSKFMDFYRHVMNDSEASARLGQMAESLTQDKDQDAQLNALIAFAAEEGYVFEKDEVKAFVEGMQVGGELSDEELEVVAGGKIGCCYLGGKGDSVCVLVGAFTAAGGCVLVGIWKY